MRRSYVRYSDADKRQYAIAHDRVRKQARDEALGYEDHTLRHDSCLTCGARFNKRNHLRSRGHQPPVRLMAQCRHRGLKAPYQPVVLDQCLDCNMKQGYQLLHEWKPELPSIEILLRDGFPQPKVTPAQTRWQARERHEALIASLTKRISDLTERIGEYERPYVNPLRERHEEQLKNLLRQGPLKPLLGRGGAYRQWRRFVLAQHHAVMRARRDEEQMRGERAAGVATLRARLIREEKRLGDLIATPPEPEVAYPDDGGWCCPEHRVFAVQFTRIGREYRACPTCSHFERLP